MNIWFSIFLIHALIFATYHILIFSDGTSAFFPSSTWLVSLNRFTRFWCTSNSRWTRASVDTWEKINRDPNLSVCFPNRVFDTRSIVFFLYIRCSAWADRLRRNYTMSGMDHISQWFFSVCISRNKCYSKSKKEDIFDNPLEQDNSCSNIKINWAKFWIKAFLICNQIECIRYKKESN